LEGKVKKILIIGANGYIGGNLSYLLAQNGHCITALCYPSIPDNAEWCAKMNEVITGDIRSNEVIDQLTNQKYDTVIHLVSLDHNDSNMDPNIVNSINVMPVWNLLETFKKKENLKQFIYFSTIHVYGEFQDSIIDEDQQLEPKNTYALTHMLAENICNYYHKSSEINCINLRLSNSYGSPFFNDNNCWWLVVNDLCRKAFLKKKIGLKSDGSPLRDFIHFKDIFQAVNLMITQKKFDFNNIFHLSSGSYVSIYELALKVQDEYEKRYCTKIPIDFPEGVIPKANSFSKAQMSNMKMKNLGFNKKISISEGIQELFTYLENNER
jgi:UDP-glucose 4-epimerase